MAKESRIEILKGNDAGAQFRIMGGRVLFGRSSDCDIIITDSSVSRTHAELTNVGGKFLLKDMHSSNGVFVNGKKITEHFLVPGDMLTMGNHAYRYIEIEASDIPPQTPPPHPRVEGTIPGISMPHSSTGVNIPGLSLGSGAKKKRIFLYGGVSAFLVLILIISLSGGNNKTTVKPSDNNNASVKQGTENGTEEEEDIAYKRKIPDDERELFIKANGYYFDGEREVRLKNYSRALEDFKKALAFYPQHEKAKMAANTTADKIKTESLAQLNTGKKMFSQHRYDDAIRSFEEVINLNIRQSDSDLFKEAEKWKEMAEKRKGEIFEQ